MKARLVSYSIACVLIPLTVGAQTTKVLLWNPGNPTDGQRVYHPEPVLLVHGINASDEGWEKYKSIVQLPCFYAPFDNPGLLPQIQDDFATYYLPQGARDLIEADNSRNLYRATQRNYLQTFNYGDPPTVDNTKSHDRQTFDHIPWNAVAADRNNLPCKECQI